MQDIAHGKNHPADAVAIEVAPQEPPVNLANPNNGRIENSSPQSLLRDKVRRASSDGATYLECADGSVSDCVEGQYLGTRDDQSTAKMRTIEKDIAKTLTQANGNTMLNRMGTLTLNDVLGSSTGEPPMAAGNMDYAANITRPYERQLIESLADSGEITHTGLVKAALRVCNNDAPLAILTLANFTKNMATVERRQISSENIEPSLREVYEKAKIDSIFERIEGFSDSMFQKYNKEGAIYHFYGAMLAASQLGDEASGLVKYDNFVRAGGRTDQIKNAAGLAGVRVGLKVFKAIYRPDPKTATEAFLRALSE